MSQDKAFKQIFNTSYKKSPVAVVSWEEIDTEHMKTSPYSSLSFPNSASAAFASLSAPIYHLQQIQLETVMSESSLISIICLVC